jgi:hypothetical protein
VGRTEAELLVVTVTAVYPAAATTDLPTGAPGMYSPGV